MVSGLVMRVSSLPGRPLACTARASSAEMRAVRVSMLPSAMIVSPQPSFACARPSCRCGGRLGSRRVRRCGATGTQARDFARESSRGSEQAAGGRGGEAEQADATPDGVRTCRRGRQGNAQQLSVRGAPWPGCVVPFQVHWLGINPDGDPSDCRRHLHGKQVKQVIKRTQSYTECPQSFTEKYLLALRADDGCAGHKTLRAALFAFSVKLCGHSV